MNAYDWRANASDVFGRYCAATRTLCGTLASALHAGMPKWTGRAGDQGASISRRNRTPVRSSPSTPNLSAGFPPTTSLPSTKAISLLRYAERTSSRNPWSLRTAPYTTKSNSCARILSVMRVLSIPLRSGSTPANENPSPYSDGSPGFVGADRCRWYGTSTTSCPRDTSPASNVSDM